jgi:SAM-dependent methyltransferase
MKEMFVKPNLYFCPKCKNPLGERSGMSQMHCENCGRNYPIIDGVPDFLIGDFQTGDLDHVFRLSKKVDVLAPIYESIFWGDWVAWLSGAHNTTVASTADFHTESFKGITGNLLDVACGPSTYGRRLALPTRNIYGIDISLKMLKRGMSFIKRSKIPGIYLSRARVEELPFPNEIFDGVICSGSLHLFPDTAVALREISRTMKKGAPLSVQTIVDWNSMIMGSLKKRKSLTHVFEIPELKKYFLDSGFEGFEPTQDGPSIMFRTRKVNINE